MHHQRRGRLARAGTGAGRGQRGWINRSLVLDDGLLVTSELGFGIHDATSLADAGWLACQVSPDRSGGHSGSWSHS